MRFARLLVALSLCAVVSCGGDASVTPSTVSFTGTYTLKTVNSQNLPFTIAQIEGYSLAVVSSSLTIVDGGSWSETRVVRTTQNSQTTDQPVADGGTWIRSGNVLNLQSNRSSVTVYSGTFSGTQLNFTDFNYPYVFVR